jgi:hypothetical protein
MYLFSSKVEIVEKLKIYNLRPDGIQTSEIDQWNCLNQASPQQGVPTWLHNLN